MTVVVTIKNFKKLWRNLYSMYNSFHFYLIFKIQFSNSKLTWRDDRFTEALQCLFSFDKLSMN